MLKVIIVFFWILLFISVCVAGNGQMGDVTEDITGVPENNGFDFESTDAVSVELHLPENQSESQNIKDPSRFVSSEIPVILDMDELPDEIFDWFYREGEQPSDVIVRHEIDYVYLTDSSQTYPVTLVKAGDTFLGWDVESVSTNFLEFDDGRIWYDYISVQFRGEVEILTRAHRYSFEPGQSWYLNAIVDAQWPNLLPSDINLYTEGFIILPGELLDRLVEDGFDGSIKGDTNIYHEYILQIRDFQLYMDFYEGFPLYWSNAELLGFERVLD